MATQDHTTPRPFDRLADLLGLYESLSSLAAADIGQSSPTLLLLDHLNAQLRAFVDEQDERGLVS